MQVRRGVASTYLSVQLASPRPNLPIDILKHSSYTDEIHPPEDHYVRGGVRRLAHSLAVWWPLISDQGVPQGGAQPQRLET